MDDNDGVGEIEEGQADESVKTSIRGCRRFLTDFQLRFHRFSNFFDFFKSLRILVD